MVSEQSLARVRVQYQRVWSTLANASERWRGQAVDERRRPCPAHVLFTRRALALFPAKPPEHLPHAGRRWYRRAGDPLSRVRALSRRADHLSQWAIPRVLPEQRRVVTLGAAPWKRPTAGSMIRRRDFATSDRRARGGHRYSDFRRRLTQFSESPFLQRSNVTNSLERTCLLILTKLAAGESITQSRQEFRMMTSSIRPMMRPIF